MNLATEWPDATIRYRLNLPHVLHTVSPALSSLHVSRAATLHPELSAILRPSHCPRCGTYRFSGDHSTYPVDPSAKEKRRRTTSSRPQTLQRSCRLCGFSIDTCASPPLNVNHSSMPSSGLSKFESTPPVPQAKELREESSPAGSRRPVLETGPTAVTACPPVPPSGRQARPEPAHSKTSSLREMLSRDRRREEVVKAQKKKKEGHEGLAAFLKEL